MKKIYIPKDELYDMYIVRNISRKECAKYFGVSESVIACRLREYGIKHDEKTIKANRKRGLIKKYGVETPFAVKEVREKSKKTMLEKYGVEYTAQSLELQKKMQKTTLQKYKKKNYVETNEFQAKSLQTCLEKYGVEHPCQISQCIEALEKAVGHSKPEKEFANLLEKYDIVYEQEYTLRGFKYDFKVNNYLFEINPSGTHNVTFGLFGKKPKSKNYHYTKHVVAKEFNFRCIHIFDWDNEEKIIKTFLVEKERVYARKCEIKGVSVNEAKQFLNENHLQGYANDLIRLGLYYNNELVEIMTFAKPRYNKKYDYEIIRLCAIKNVVGGAQRLLSEFIKMYNPKNIISYCDLSKFDGNVYRQLGFKSINKPQPSKHWYNLKTGQHITDNLLRQKGFDQLFKTNYGKGTSNEDLMRESGFVEIFDCGQLTFLLAL